MTLAPARYARYVVVGDNGETWDTRHYDDDAEAFEDHNGRTWRRAAVTRQQYTTAEAARVELDAEVRNPRP